MTAADISTNLGATNLGAVRAIPFRPETATAILLRTDGSLREDKGRMRMLLRDIVLFSCLAAFVAGLVIAAATLLI